MSLPHVLLGMLSRPASGYDLGQTFQQAVRHFWSAELSQIYPTLARMEDRGLLKSEKVESEKGPPRKVYARTNAGHEELKDWLMGGPVVRNERIEYLTQLFFIDEIPIEARISFMEDLRDDFDAHYRELVEIEKNWAADDPRYPDKLPDEEMCKQMTLVLGIRKYRVIADWCQDCVDRFKARRQESLPK